jgi:hypothetical protein
VVWAPVKLHGELLFGPVAIDLPAVDVDVPLRLRDLGVLSEKGVEVALKIGFPVSGRK